MKVLVMRPEAASPRTAAGLAARGHEAILAPMLAIMDLATPIPETAFDAILATSANGLTRLAKRPEIARLSKLPLVAVGDRTAAAGREAGFETVHVADGDGRSLVAEVRSRFLASGRFMHAAGADRAFDVAGALSEHGYEVTVVELYRAVAAAKLPEAATRALADGSARAALHHSRRIAETFLALVAAEGLDDRVRELAHAALAARVATPLQVFGCARVAVAERPDEAALFEALANVVDCQGPTGSQSSPERSS